MPPFDRAAFEERLLEKLQHRPDLFDLRLVEIGVTAGIVLVGLVLIVQAIRRPRPAPPPRGIPETPTWGVLDVLGIAAAIVLAPIVALAAAVRLGAPAVQPGVEPGYPHMMAAMLANASIALLAIGLVARRGQSPRALGLHAEDAAASARTGLRLLVTVFPIFLGAQQVAQWIFRRLEVPHEINPAAVLLLTEDDAGRVLAIALGAALLAPLSEEILFRGFFYPVFRQRLGPRTAILATSALFTFVHPPVDWVPLFILATALAWAYEKTGSLVAPIAMHAANNALGVATLLLERHIYRS